MVPAGALPKVDPIRNIVVLGMGGSGIAGDVVSASLNDELPVPVNVLKQIRTPAYVGPNTLAFAMSYSGDTEETVSMAKSAVERGAQLVAVSCGGELEALAGDSGALHVQCPPGYLPRAAVGALVAPLCTVLYRLGLAPGAHALMLRAQEQLALRRDGCGPSIDGQANPARELARRIGRTIPLIYGGGAIGAVAAYRWKCDVNENAKSPAFWHAYPELDHNEICSWGQHGDVTRQLITLVELRHGFEHPRLRRASTRPATSSRSACTRCSRSRPRVKGGSRNCSISCTWATGPAATSRCRTTSTPDRSTRSSTSRRRFVKPVVGFTRSWNTSGRE